MTAEQVLDVDRQQSMGILVKVTIAAGKRKVEISADALVPAIVAPVTSPFAESVPGVPEEQAVRNAGETTMFAALDALFSRPGSGDERSTVLEGEVDEAVVPEQTTALEFRERIERVVEFLQGPDALVDEVASSHIIRLLEGRA